MLRARLIRTTVFSIAALLAMGWSPRVLAQQTLPKSTESEPAERPVLRLDAPPSSSVVDVVALNLSADAFARLVGLGYQVIESTKLPFLGYELTRLLVPADRHFASVQRVNHVHEISVPVPSISAAPNQEEATPFTCSPDRCYGPSMIGWSPQLAACARGVRIGLVGTGIDKQHPALAGLRVTVSSFRGAQEPPAPSWHGTAMLALLAAGPGGGVPGLIPDAEFFVADVSSIDQRGRPVADALSLLKALNWMGEQRMNIVNMYISGPRDALLHDAIQHLSRAGIRIVAPVSDAGPAERLAYPAAYHEVISVTAVDRYRNLYSNAGHGKYIDLATPGVDIWTAATGNRFGSYTGTSLAVPYVTAALAIVHGSVPPALAADLNGKEHYVSRLRTRDFNEPRYGRGILIAPDSCAAAPSDYRPRRHKKTWSSTVQPMEKN